MTPEPRDDSDAPGVLTPMRDLWECVYCGRTHYSETGTGSDVVCCGERGHVSPLTYEDDDEDE